MESIIGSWMAAEPVSYVVYVFIIIGIIILIGYTVFLKRTGTKLKRLNSVNDTIWNNVQEYLFLIDTSSHIYKTNFYSLNQMAPPDHPVCFGEVMECRHSCDVGKCGLHAACKTCPVRNKIRETFSRKDKFSNLEIVMSLRMLAEQTNEYSVRISGTYLCIDKNEYVLLTVHDISREKALEKSVRVSNEKFLSIFNNLPVGCAICDKEGVLREVNEAYVDYNGLNSKEDALYVLNIFDNPCINSEFKEMMRKGIPVSGEVKYDYARLNKEYVHSRHKSVKYYRFIVNYLKDAKGEIEYYTILWVDNTFIHKTLRENQAFQDMIAMASSVSNIGFGSVNILKNEQIATPEYLKNLGGIEHEDIRSVFVRFENMYPADREILFNYLTEAKRNKVAPLVKDVRIKMDDSYRWIKQFMMQQTFDPENGNITLLGVNIDIDEQKKTEEKFKKAKEKAESSDKLKSAFLANMSHEIRTPLNAIVGFSELLASTDNKEDKENFRQIIHCNNDLLLQLINDILDLSKIEADTLEFNWSNVDLEILFREIEQGIRLKNAPDSKVKIEFVCTLSHCVIYTERTRISQVMNNFLTNALKFTEKGSITFGYENRENGLYFYVADTGCGIPEDQLDSIFERFVKLDNFKQGTGLGLAICHSIVKKLGGEMGVDSIQGKGSTFWFKLPCKPLMEPPGENKLPAFSTDLTHVKNKNAEKQERASLLIAEDMADNYHLYEVLLGNKYNLVHAWNGEEAVELFVKHQPDAILMDIRMPLCDGFEATEAIRQLSADIPIFAVTAFAYEEDKQKILSRGFNGYLTKPIKSNELFELLSSINL